jgi:hypothetical protein
LWTFEEATGKNIVEGEDPGPGPMAEAIHHCLIQAGTGKSVVFPESAEFESAIAQSHRKGEKAYHVKAHRGSKEGTYSFAPPTSVTLWLTFIAGYIFLTRVGILWGFKKPLAFLDFGSIDSISYTAVLRNTFNLVVATPHGEIEFAMVDQADYSGINDYIQKHGLQDASMAAARRAKKLNINPPAEKQNGANVGGTEDDDGETELQKAERMLQDEEDDEEEDYDPGSDGESEGSGSDSEEEAGEGQEYEEGEGEGEGEGEEYEEGYEEGYDGEEMDGEEQY